MGNSFEKLSEILSTVPEYVIDGKLNKNIIAELARKYDAKLLNTLLSDQTTKKLFFTETDAGIIFKRDSSNIIPTFIFPPG